MLKAIIFDLDGTLLPMNEDEFTKGYFTLLCKKLSKYGYEPNELINTVWAGTKAMIMNNGEKTNEEVFWDVFYKKYGEKGLTDKALFDEFYVTDFLKTKSFCKENNLAKTIVSEIRKMGLKTILASNPVFPKKGMITRIGFVDLKEKDFDYISSYETSHYAKPNPKFLSEILEKNNLKSDEVIYFGNSEKEDYAPSTKVGIKCFLVGDNVSLVNKEKSIETVKYKDILDIIREYKNNLK